jgi:hypothetical protein
MPTYLLYLWGSLLQEPHLSFIFGLNTVHVPTNMDKNMQ